MSFLFRLAIVMFWLVVFCGALYISIVIVNRGLQWLLRSLGYEVGDFFSWFRSILPKRKKKRKVHYTRPPTMKE